MANQESQRSADQELRELNARLKQFESSRPHEGRGREIAAVKQAIREAEARIDAAKAQAASKAPAKGQG